MVIPVDDARLRSALAALERGAPGAAEALAAELGGAWADALRAHQWLADPVRGRMPALDALHAAAGEQPVAVACACAALERRAVLACDAAGLEAALSLHTRVAAPDDLPLETARLWRDLMTGAGGVRDAAAALAARATRGAAAALVIEANALRALAALDEGAVADAEALARLSSRMAQTEGIPQAEYLAHLVLARVRRASGRPHLAIRILAALSRVVPQAWRFWLEWERTFAPTTDAATGDEGDRPLAALIAAAESGERDAFTRAGASAVARASGWQALAREAALVAAALDPDAAVPDALAAWARGEVVAAPAGIDGLCLEGLGAAGDSAVAYVVSAPGAVARRCLRPGLALAVAPGATALPQTQRRQGRLDAALATLALAGDEGMDEPAFFKAVYGFGYVRRIHEPPLRVLIRRAGERMGDAGQVVREGERVALRLARAVVLADPRCSPAVDYRVLRLVASHGSTSSADTARELGIPLRTAQHALRELAATGVLRAVPAAHGHRYVVEDTTFSEPSRY